MPLPPELVKLKHAVQTYHHRLPIIPNDFTPHSLDPCLSSFPLTPNKKTLPSFPKIKAKEGYRCYSVQLFPNEEQSHILKRWLEAYRLMYNETLAYIKAKYEETKTYEVNFMRLRTHHLKDIKHTIQLQSQSKTLSRNTKIMSHMLDGAIKLACANYKSALSNLKQKNIKHFRIRYWRPSQPYKRLDIESCYFRDNNVICPRVLGSLKCLKDGAPFVIPTHICDSTLQYDRINETYLLWIPEKLEAEVIPSREKWISLDPGARRFLTGVSNTEILYCGEGYDKKLQTYIQDRNRYKKLNISPRKKKKRWNRIQRKIKGLVNDLHWKCCNYLTRNYETILIGDLSAKRVSSKRLHLASLTKQTLLSLSHYQFKQRLRYKASLRGSRVLEINESYTTKVCHQCGYVNNVGCMRNFHCSQCACNVDRDVKGGLCIALKAFG
jgi:IS605 OrfB family transposase